MSDSLQPHGLQQASFPCLSPSPRACSHSCPLVQWCHPTVSSSVIPFSSCRLFFPASGSFPMSQFFPSGGQNTGASASASELPMNIQGWFPLGLTCFISLLSKELWRVFSSTLLPCPSINPVLLKEVEQGFLALSPPKMMESNPNALARQEKEIPGVYSCTWLML